MKNTFAIGFSILPGLFFPSAQAVAVSAKSPFIAIQRGHQSSLPIIGIPPMRGQLKAQTPLIGVVGAVPASSQVDDAELFRVGSFFDGPSILPAPGIKDAPRLLGEENNVRRLLRLLRRGPPAPKTKRRMTARQAHGQLRASGVSSKLMPAINIDHRQRVAVILPGSQSRLNRFAAALKRRFDYGVWYAPAILKKNGAYAGISTKNKIIFMSEDSIRAGDPNEPKIAHELGHLWIDAIGHAGRLYPVQGWVRAQGASLSEFVRGKTRAAYRRHLGLDEMESYARGAQHALCQLDEALGNAKTEGTRRIWKVLGGELRMGRQTAEQAARAAKASLRALGPGTVEFKKLEHMMARIMIKPRSGRGRFEVFLPLPGSSGPDDARNISLLRRQLAILQSRARAQLRAFTQAHKLGKRIEGKLKL